MPRSHIVKKIFHGSIAEELDIEEGDKFLSINGEPIEDIFDYQFLIQDSYIEVLVEKTDGEQWLLEVDKDPDEDLGVEFENGLMDEYRHCHNKCVFCFIDQMPPGMRETLYFKDDDSRLSFLQGNYVTLTNMSDHDVERICRYHLSPINISFQTMNPELRCKMLNNRFAGEALKKVDVLNEAGIRMNGQIVLCKGLNDGDELEYSIRQLMNYIPNLESVSVVPVGLSKYREGLYPLEPFEGNEAAVVIDLIEGYQQECYEKFGTHFVHASDEWYILAGRELPEAERYDGYLQLENGVGMLRLFMNEFQEAIEEYKEKSLFPNLEGKGKHSKEKSLFPNQGGKEKYSHKSIEEMPGKAMGENPRETAGETNQGTSGEFSREISLATGLLAYPYMEHMASTLMQECPGLKINVYPIVNHFFGENITVSGLLTGQDIRAQLLDKELGSKLFLPENVLRSGEDVFLDDMTLGELEKSLQVPIYIVKSSGYEFVRAIIG